MSVVLRALISRCIQREHPYSHRPLASLLLGLVGLAALLGGLAVNANTSAAPDPDVPGAQQGSPSVQVHVPYVSSEPPPTPSPSPTPAPTPSPEPPDEPAPGEDFRDLQDDLRATVDGYWSPGQFAIAVTDLQTGEMIGVNGDEWHFSGCVMNFFVILQIVRDVESGRIPIEQVDETIAETIRSSNATTALELYRIAGGGDIIAGLEQVDRLVRDVIRLDRVFLDHPPSYGQYSRDLNPNNWITAHDVNRALTMLYNGDLLSERWTDYLLTRMEGVKPGLNYLTAYGNGGTTSHKNGFFPYTGGYVDNDAGIVRFERNGQEYAYAVTFLSMGVPVKYNDIPLAQDMMVQIWNYFDQKYQ